MWLTLPRISLRRARHFPHNNEMCHKWHPREARMEIGAQCASWLPVPILCLHLTVYFCKRAFGAVAGADLFVSLARPPPISWRPSLLPLDSLPFWIQFRLLVRRRIFVYLRWLLIQGICLPFSFNFLSYGFYGSPESTGVWMEGVETLERDGTTAQLMFIFIFLLLVSSFLTSLFFNSIQNSSSCLRSIEF